MDKRDSGTGREKAEEASIGRLLDTFLPETVKRALFMGAGMLFLTEESIRKAMAEFNIPREAVSFLMKQSEKSKKELLAIFQREFKNFLSRIDPTRLTKDVLDGISLEINTQITFRVKKDDDSLRPTIDRFRARPSVKNDRR
jgi:hypothetical protein